MVIDERIGDDGVSVATRLESANGGGCLLIDGERQVVLPISVVAGVLRRYGREVEPALLHGGDRLEIGEVALVQFRFHAVVDAEGRDYLALAQPGSLPVAAIARDIASALRFVARNAR